MLAVHIATSGETRRAWAARLGISDGHLSQIVNGRKAPSLALALRIERATAGAVPVQVWATPDPATAAGKNPDPPAVRP